MELQGKKIEFDLEEFVPLLLSNKQEGFDTEDVKFMIFFAHYVSGFLELLNTYMREDKNEKI